MPITLHNDVDDSSMVHPAMPNGSPSQRIVNAANAMSYVDDEKGRRLGWRRLDALEEFDLSELAGANNVGNAQWMLLAMVAFCVREIDGQPMSRPGSKNDLRARVKLLGAEGINAVMSQLSPPKEEEDPLSDGFSEIRSEPQTSDMDRAKNSQGTPR